MNGDEREPLLLENRYGELSLIQYFVLGFAAALCLASTDMYIPMLAKVKRDLSASAMSISLSLTVNWVLSGFSGPLWGLLASLQSFGRKGSLCTGLFIFMLGTIISGTAGSAEWLILGRSIQGLGEGSARAIAEIILSDVYTDLDQRNEALAKLTSTYPLVIISAPILGGFIGKYLGWRAIFVVLFFWGFCVFVLSTFCLPETFSRTTREKEEQAGTTYMRLACQDRINRHLGRVLRVIRHKQVFAGILFNFSTNAVVGTMLSYYPYTLEFEYGYPPQIAGIIIGSMGLSCFAGAVTNSTLSKLSPLEGRDKVHAFFRVGAIVYTMLTLSIVLATLFLALAPDNNKIFGFNVKPLLSLFDSFFFSLTFLMLATFLMFFNYPCIFSIMFEHVEEADNLRPTAVSMNSGCLILGFGASSLLVGLIFQITTAQLGSSLVFYALLSFWTSVGVIILFSSFDTLRSIHCCKRNATSVLHPTNGSSHTSSRQRNDDTDFPDKEGRLASA